MSVYGNRSYETSMEREERLLAEYREANAKDFNDVRAPLTRLLRRILARNPGYSIALSISLLVLFILILIEPPLIRVVLVGLLVAVAISTIIYLFRMLYRYLKSLKP